MNTKVFDRFVELLDAKAEGEEVTLGDFEVLFSDEEWGELDVWTIGLIILMRGYSGLVDDMIEDCKERAKKNPKLKEDLEMAKYIKKKLTENGFRLLRFEEIVSSLP